MAFHAQLRRLMKDAAGDPVRFTSACAPATDEQLIWLHIQAKEAGATEIDAEIARLYQARFGTAIPDEEPEPPYNVETQPSDETEIWDLADFARGDLPLSPMLAGRTRGEINRFITVASRLSAALYERASERLGKDPSGGDWVNWADWIVGLGKETYERALANPESVQREVPEEIEYFGDKLIDAYQERTQRRHDAP